MKWLVYGFSAAPWDGRQTVGTKSRWIGCVRWHSVLVCGFGGGGGKLRSPRRWDSQPLHAGTPLSCLTDGPAGCRLVLGAAALRDHTGTNTHTRHFNQHFHLLLTWTWGKTDCQRPPSSSEGRRRWHFRNLKFLLLNRPQPEKNPERQIADTHPQSARLGRASCLKCLVEFSWSSRQQSLLLLFASYLKSCFEFHLTIQLQKNPPLDKKNDPQKIKRTQKQSSTLQSIIISMDGWMDKTEFQAGCFISWEHPPESERLRSKWLPLHVSPFTDGSFIHHPYDICAAVGHACSCLRSENKGAKRR